MSSLTRRNFVRAGLAGAAPFVVPVGLARAQKRIPREPLITRGAFRRGVASGLPATDGLVLWTRVDDIERSGRITLEVARDPGFGNVIQRKEVRAAAIRDFTARSRVSGLDPASEYFYRFSTKGQSSPVGRFRTALPADSREPVRIGFYSCQDYQAGYYAAQKGLAAEPDLDLVVCLGDYIYEQTFYDGPADRKDTTGPNRDAEVLSLPDYRDKYRLYRSDADLQALHAAHPFVGIWDDHEVEDNYADGKRDPAKKDAPKLDHVVRQRNGYLAWFEYMPRIRTRPVNTSIIGNLRLGANAELFLLDQRQFRDQQPCGGELLVPCPEAETRSATLLGPEQKAWFKDAVVRSQATWKLVGNQVMIMGLDGAPAVSLNVDSWDGYGAERREILEHFEAQGVKDLSFLTGDIHTFFAGELRTNGRITGRPIGTEFVGGSATSEGIGEIVGEGPATAIEQGVTVNNPHIRFSDFRKRGYGVATAYPDRLEVELKTVSTVKERGGTVSSLARFRVPKGTTQVERF